MISTTKTHQLFRQGIGRRLLSLVQFISWVKVRNISIHLCATTKSIPFYDLIRFTEYKTKFESLPEVMKIALKLENIHDVGKEHGLYSIFLSNHLLSFPTSLPKIILKKYYKWLTSIMLTIRFIDRNKKLLLEIATQN